MMMDSPEAKRETELIHRIVEDTCRTLETAHLPPNPKDPSNGILAWRLRPSELRSIAIQEYQSPSQPWGLKINLANLRIGPEHTQSIARSLILNHNVTSLDLSCSDMCTAASVELFRCVARNTTLKHLNVNGNYIDYNGGIAAATCVGKLETLHMACNQLGDRGCMAIAEALSRSTTMKFLNVRANGASIYGVYRLIEALDPTVLNRLSEDCKNDIAAARREHKQEQASLARTAAQQHQSHGSPTAMASGSSFQRMTSSGASSIFSSTGSPDGAHSSPLSNYKRSASVAAFSQTGDSNIGGVNTSRSERTVGLTPRKSFLQHSAGSEQSDTPAVTAIVAPRPPTPLSVDEKLPKCTTCNALWVQGNVGILNEMLDALNKVLSQRVPQPPEGLNAKKKKKKGKK